MLGQILFFWNQSYAENVLKCSKHWCCRPNPHKIYGVDRGRFLNKEEIFLLVFFFFFLPYLVYPKVWRNFFFYYFDFFLVRVSGLEIRPSASNFIMFWYSQEFKEKSLSVYCRRFKWCEFTVPPSVSIVGSTLNSTHLFPP